MASAAACQHIGFRNFVFGGEPSPLFHLIGGRLPVHIEYLILWPQELLRLTMAPKTPFHLK
jgi:hypothetical protein